MTEEALALRLLFLTLLTIFNERAGSATEFGTKNFFYKFNEPCYLPQSKIKWSRQKKPQNIFYCDAAVHTQQCNTVKQSKVENILKSINSSSYNRFGRVYGTQHTNTCTTLKQVSVNICVGCYLVCMHFIYATEKWFLLQVGAASSTPTLLLETTIWLRKLILKQCFVFRVLSLGSGMMVILENMPGISAFDFVFVIVQPAQLNQLFKESEEIRKQIQENVQQYEWKILKLLLIRE